MSGVDGRSSCGRELLDHISIPFNFDTDDSTHGFLDSSSRPDPNEEKDGSSGSSRSSTDGKCSITQVDEVPLLFNKSQVQPAMRSTLHIRSLESGHSSMEERQSRFGHSISTYKPSKKDTEFSSRYNHAKEKRQKRAERADRKYISIKIEGDENDYSIQKILEKLGEPDKDKKRAKNKEVDDEETGEEASESVSLIEVEEAKEKRKGKARDRKLRRSKEDKLLETEKKFSSDAEEDDSGSSLVGEAPVVGTFSSTVEFNHIKANVALVDTSPLDLRRQFSRSTENLTSFTEVTKKQKRKKKPTEDTYPTVTRSVRTIAPFRSKPYNNVGAPNENSTSQDSNSVKFEGDRMNLARATWKKAPLVQSRSVDGSALRRNATVITAPIPSKSQSEVKELDLAVDFPPLPDVSHNVDSSIVSASVWPRPKPSASDSQMAVIETKVGHESNSLSSSPPNLIVQTSELPAGLAAGTALPDVTAQPNTHVSLNDELLYVPTTRAVQESSYGQPSPGLYEDCDAFTQAHHIWQVCDVSNEIIEKSVVETGERNSQSNGGEICQLPMSYRVVSAAAKKLAQEAQKTDLVEGNAGESIVMECERVDPVVRPGHFENAKMSSEALMSVQPVVPTYTQIVANNFDRKHFGVGGSFQATHAYQVPCMNPIDNPIALQATSESVMPCGFSSDAVVFCQELEGSSWSSPANVVFGFNIDQELLSPSNSGIGPNGDKGPSEGPKPLALNEEDNAILGYGANLDDLSIHKVSSDDSGIINTDLSPESGICIDQQIQNFFPLNQSHPDKLGSSDSGASSWADPDDHPEESKSSTEASGSPVQFDVKFNYSEIVVFLRDSWLQIQDKLKTTDPVSICYYDDTVSC